MSGAGWASQRRCSQGSTTKEVASTFEEEDAASGVAGRPDRPMIRATYHYGLAHERFEHFANALDDREMPMARPHGHARIGEPLREVVRVLDRHGAIRVAVPELHGH